MFLEEEEKEKEREGGGGGGEGRGLLHIKYCYDIYKIYKIAGLFKSLRRKTIKK